MRNWDCSPMTFVFDDIAISLACNDVHVQVA